MPQVDETVAETEAEPKEKPEATEAGRETPTDTKTAILITFTCLFCLLVIAAHSFFLIWMGYPPRTDSQGVVQITTMLLGFYIGSLLVLKNGQAKPSELQTLFMGMLITAVGSVLS